MINVIIAENQALFRLGLTGMLAATDDFRIVGQPRSPDQLLTALKRANPHLLMMSTSFLPVFSQIQRALLRRQTALLVLAEDNDRVAYVRCLRARGVVYRSMGGDSMIDAMRRVARGELFIQKRSSDKRKKRILYICYDPAVLALRECFLLGMGYQVCTVQGQDGLLALQDDISLDLVLIGDEGSLAEQQRTARSVNEMYPRASIISLCHGSEKVAEVDYSVSSAGLDAWPDSADNDSRRPLAWVSMCCEPFLASCFNGSGMRAGPWQSSSRPFCR
jgi:hypothetical protein